MLAPHLVHPINTREQTTAASHGADDHEGKQSEIADPKTIDNHASFQFFLSKT
jgi:hypothetical protein